MEMNRKNGNNSTNNKNDSNTNSNKNSDRNITSDCTTDDGSCCIGNVPKSKELTTYLTGIGTGF
ncbi:hypothetical protein OS493_037962 [Desmophyllum pertusum]|uniref:Uncharacterized protein n=1 Tax=Desmophyllum pertusum TaxID=174260 RepID=A0A9X0CGZ7_9CNID|nr:hypothetical protein OS493_037962 [Desmophyllum pertusum]